MRTKLLARLRGKHPRMEGVGEYDGMKGSM